MAEWFQFSLGRLLVLAVALPACVGAIIVDVQASDSCGFLLAVLCLAFFVWIAIRQTRNPTYTMLGVFAFFLLWPIWSIPVVLALAVLGVID